MEASKRRDILQDVLTEYGYTGWYVIEPITLNPENFLLFNPTEKKMAEISIPEARLADPRQRRAIGESVALTIENSSYALPQAPQSASRSSRP